MQAMVRRLELDKINPFDYLHPPWRPPADHEEGIERCRQFMREGKAIRPIVVIPMKLMSAQWTLEFPDKEYQRLDGFKRFWAHQMEGSVEIDCIVIDTYWPGAQHGHPMTIEEQEWATLTQSS